MSGQAVKVLLRRALREPLLHFTLVGATLFGISGRMDGPAAEGSDEILVTRSQIEQLVIGFTRTWGRAPTRQEMDGLVEEYIREEVLYREATAMELDRDDTIVRRRMRQKLEFIIGDLAGMKEPPTERELRSYLERNSDQYREGPRYSFEHIIFNPEKRGASAGSDARAVLARLNGLDGGRIDVDTLGDAFLLPFEFDSLSEEETEQLFGGGLGRSVARTEVGTWAGPFESAYGLHLVLVHERTAGSVPALTRVRDVVLADLMSERRQQALEAEYARLRQRYTVVIEPPEIAAAVP